MLYPFRIENDVCIISLEGKLIESRIDQLEDFLSQLPDKNVKGGILNLKNVDYMDSSGMGGIIFIQNFFKNQNLQLVLCEMNRSIEEIFDMASLDQIIKAYKTEPEALNSFSEKTS